MRTSTIITAAAALFFTATAQAQTSSAPRKLTLEQCIATALKNNYGVRAAQNETEKAEILQATAWDLDKTSVSLSQDPTSGGSPDNALTLSQTFEFPTVYTSRRNTLKAETAVAKSRTDISRKQLAQEVATAYTEMVYALEKQNILPSQDSILDNYLKLASIRYKAGEARQLERLTASRMKHENEMEIERAKTDYLSLQHKIGQLLNTDENILPADGKLVALDYHETTGYDFAQSAEGNLNAREIEKADKAVKEAKSGYLPNFSVGLSTQLVLKGWNPYGVDRSRFAKGNFMGFEVGVGLPLFFGATRAKVKAAIKERETAELYAQQQRLQIQSEYLAERNNLDAAKKRMDYYQSEGLGEAQEMERIARVSYENGDIGYMEYVQGLLEAMNTRLKYAETVKEYNIAVINLNTIAK